MNDIEQQHINDLFGESSDKTMEDYFTQLELLVTGVLTKDELKVEFKKQFPDETDWSF